MYILSQNFKNVNLYPMAGLASLDNFQYLSEFSSLLDKMQKLFDAISRADS